MSPASFGIYSNKPIENYIEDMVGDYLNKISEENPKIELFSPNPAINFIQLDQAAGWIRYEIYNLTGELIKSGIPENNVIDVSDLSMGVYLINFENKIFSRKKKLIKN